MSSLHQVIRLMSRRRARDAVLVPLGIGALGAVGGGLLLRGSPSPATALAVAVLVIAGSAALLRRAGAGGQALAAVFLVLLLPALLLLAVSVRVTSRGPVLVRHPPAGPGGPEQALVFRTTTDDAGPAHGSASVSRLTPVGRVLRRLDLDQLPRLLDAAAGRAPLPGTGRG